MMAQIDKNLKDQIINQAVAIGASLAGIVRSEDLKKSSSYDLYEKNPYYATYTKTPEWTIDDRSILVLALYHEPKKPEMDWWDTRPGGTLGNKALIDIQKRMKKWLVEELKIQSKNLLYRLEEGGIFLKDASALAGIGIIGKNNLLITPIYGPRVRLRAMFLDADLEPDQPLDYHPCSTCSMPCIKACPQHALSDDHFERDYCNLQMKIDVENPHPLTNHPDIMAVHYCRACELSCTVGR